METKPQSNSPPPGLSFLLASTAAVVASASAASIALSTVMRRSRAALSFTNEIDCKRERTDKTSSMIIPSIFLLLFLKPVAILLSRFLPWSKTRQSAAGRPTDRIVRQICAAPLQNSAAPRDDQTRAEESSLGTETKITLFEKKTKISLHLLEDTANTARDSTA